MKYQLTAHEARVIGCLLEKQVTTPEQYPLSVNAVVTACNQKTNREPVMSLSESEVQALLDTLVKRHYLRTVSGFGNRVTKYEQRFCNSEFGDLKLSAGEVAVVTTLLLRGAQAPGELRSRAQRMYEFSDMAEVESVLEGLATREDGPFVARTLLCVIQPLFGDTARSLCVKTESFFWWQDFAQLVVPSQKRI